MSKTTYQTASRDDIIDLSATFAQAAQPLFNPENNAPVMIQVEGDYASGKSLIVDAMKSALLGMDAVELARWKHTENTDGKIQGYPATISFVNARLDFINAQLNYTMRQRKFEDGFIFITNMPPFTLSKLFSSASHPSPSMKIDIRFAEGEPRPRQFGPFKWGKTGPIGKRVITVEETCTAAASPV